jgi:poly-beta-1,6-N-acetyl-D-glucosamine synthase
MSGFTIYFWIICFISVYIAVFWILVVAFFSADKKKRLVKLPRVTIVVPAWNEEKSIIQTLLSLHALDYPKKLLEVLIVDDCSTDTTVKIVRAFLKDKKYSYMKLLKNKVNMGKSNSVNRALKMATGEFFGINDADTFPDKGLLKEILRYFVHDKVAAVTPQFKAYKPKGIVERMQRIEYIFASYVRQMMSLIGTLHYTNGVLSVFRTKILQKEGGLSPDVLTEDLEVAMRLKARGYDIIMASGGLYAYTIVPDTLAKLWMQRLRWFRGYIQTCLLHRKVIGSRAHGLLGLFQMPLEIGMLMLMLVGALFMFYQLIVTGYNFLVKVISLNVHYFDGWEFPSVKEYILTFNLKLVFPILIAIIVGLWLYGRAHKHTSEKWKYLISSFTYLFLYPIIRGVQWWHAVYLEVKGAKKRWR